MPGQFYPFKIEYYDDGNQTWIFFTLDFVCNIFFTLTELETWHEHSTWLTGNKLEIRLVHHHHRHHHSHYNHHHLIPHLCCRVFFRYPSIVHPEHTARNPLIIFVTFSLFFRCVIFIYLLNENNWILFWLSESI